MIILGIDPGIKTGCAVFRNGNLARTFTIAPGDIERTIESIAPHRVIYEDSRLQSHVWTGYASKAISNKIARNVGQIDAWCRLICWVCPRRKIQAHGISPKTKGAKLNAEQFIIETGRKTRTNQHERDAVMVAWAYRFTKGDVK